MRWGLGRDATLLIAGQGVRAAGYGFTAVILGALLAARGYGPAAARASPGPLPLCRLRPPHWTPRLTSLFSAELKRLDEFVFRFNRRRSRSRGMVFYRVLELAVAHRCVRDGELEHAVEDPASTARSASVEAEDELIDSFELGGEEAGQTWCPVWRT